MVQLAGLVIASLLLLGCSDDGGDTTPPAPPVLTSVTPASPANQNEPTVDGTAEADAAIEVFADPICMAAVATGPASAEGAFAIIATVVDDSTTSFSARAIDAAGNVSECSTQTLTYIEDSTPPPVPSQLVITPTGPANNNAPQLAGSTEAAASVGVYSDAGCTTSLGSTTADVSGAFVASLAIADNATVSLHSDARDAAGNRSACSLALVMYVEDSLAPVAPTLGVTPGSPGADNVPDVTGTTEPNRPVTLFSDAACATAIGTATADGNGNFSIAATVGDDTITQFRVQVTDSAGNVSACSSPVTYEHNFLPVFRNLPLAVPCNSGNTLSFVARALDTPADSGALVFSQGAGSTCAFAGQAVAPNGAIGGTCAFPSGACTIEVVVSDGTQSASANLTIGPPVFRDVDFVAPRAFSVGAAPFAIAAGSLNGDAHLDLAVVNNGSDTVSVLFRDPANPRAHVAGPTLTVGSLPTAIAVADVNGDARADIVVVNNGDSTVSVLLQGATAGTFPTITSYATGSTPSAVAIGDLNNDNRVDLAVTNHVSNTVSVLFQHATADGSFLAATSIPAGTAPRGIAIGDVDGDGYRDLVVVSSGTNTVLLIRQNSASPGTFLASTSVTAGMTPIAIALTDLNADGKLDLAITNAAMPYSVSVRLQDATTAGSFPTITNYTTNESPVAIAVADVTGDGKVDLMVANNYGHDVYVFDQMATSAGSFLPGRTIRAGFRPSGLAAGDFDGDGTTDYAVSNFGSDNVFVVHRDPTVIGGLLTPGTFATGSGSPESTAVADFNVDGNLDIALSNAAGNSLSVFLQSAVTPGQFARTNYSSGVNPLGLVAADLDTDGRPDIVQACFQSDNVQLRYNSATVPGTFPTPINLSGIDGADDVGVADLNGDLRPDLVVTGWYSPVYVYLQSVTGGFPTRTSYAMTGNPMSPTLVDINGDARLDIVVANRANATLSIMLQSGVTAGTFLAPTTLATGTNPAAIVSADFDANGYPDLAVANQGSASVMVFLHDAATPGTFLPAVTIPVGSEPVSLAVGDLNGDLTPDLVTASYASATWSVLLQDLANPGEFLPAQEYGASFSAGGAQIADLNGDGLADITSADSMANTLQIAWQR